MSKWSGGFTPPSSEAKILKRDWVLECYRRNARQATTFGEVPRVRTPSRQEFLDNYYALNRPVVFAGRATDQRTRGRK